MILFQASVKDSVRPLKLGAIDSGFMFTRKDIGSVDSQTGLAYALPCRFTYIREQHLLDIILFEKKIFD